MTYAEAVELTSRRGSRKLQNNTYIERIDENTCGVRLHNTFVVKIHSDNTYTLNSGGWHTVTTKSRINEYSPVCVYQKNGEWYLKDGQQFYDGIKV